MSAGLAGSREAGRGEAGPASGPDAMDGLIAIDKPAGPTSHDVVTMVRRRLRPRRAGHLGTLDPAASGLLVVALGAATRCIPVWQGGAKTYEADIRFGVVTATQDLSGETLESRDTAGLTEAAARAAARALSGALLQTPPMVSAVHHEGERLYAIARRGETVERRARPITVEPWEWLAFDPPQARVRIRCSAGTYVRTLAHDLGQALGCGAALAGLRRLRSEPFSLERSVTLDEIARLEPAVLFARAGTPLSDALAGLATLALDEAEQALLSHGGRPRRAREPEHAAWIERGARSLVLRDAGGRPLALGELRASGDDAVLICPQVVFPWAVRA